MSETEDFSDDTWENDDDDDVAEDGDSEGAASDPSASGVIQATNGEGEQGVSDDSGPRRKRRRRRKDTPDDLDSFDERARLAHGFVSDVLQHMGMECRVRLRRSKEGPSDDEINLEIIGKDAARIIGKKGQVLAAIQFLVHRVINRPGQERRHILVDAEGYRSRRDNSLANMARRLGEQAVDEGKIITFEPMNPRDRRVVHLALAKFEGVITKSDGEGEQRRVQIIPVRRPAAAEPS